MDLRAYLGILAKRAWLILSVVVLSLAAAAASVLIMTPTYKGEAQIFISTQISSGNLNQELFQGSNFSADRVKSYAELVHSPTVLDPVIKELSLPVTATDLADRVTAKVPLETVLIDLSATSDSPETAAALANAVANSLTKVIGELESSETRGSSPVKATVVTPAVVPSAPAFPSIPMNLGLGLLVGLIVGVGLAVLLEKMNTSVKDAADLSTISTLPVLAAVAKDTRRNASAIVRDDRHGNRSEAYRQLRTNLQFAAFDQPTKVIIVTSAQAGEGKSSVAGNLAVAMAQVGARVCLVDGDLRRPSLASYFGLPAEVGLSTALVGHVSVDEIVQRVDDNLAVITSGQIPPNPGELLSTQRFPDLLADLSDRFDTVIIDAPPTLPAADAVAMAALADGALVVVQAGKTRRQHVERALKSLEHVNARILGLVVNMVPSKGAGRYWYTSSYTYRPKVKPAEPLQHPGDASTARLELPDAKRRRNGTAPGRSSVTMSPPRPKRSGRPNNPEG